MMDDETLYSTIIKIVTSYIRHKSQKYFKDEITQIRKEQKLEGKLDKETLDKLDIEATEKLDNESMSIDVEAALSVLQIRLKSDSSNFESREIARLRNTKSEKYLFDLSNSKLFNVDLSHTSLIRFNLSDSLIRNCILTETSLVGSDLTNTDFTDTDFTDTILNGLNLTKTKGLSQSQINQAKGDGKTKLPDGLNTPLSWNK